MKYLKILFFTSIIFSSINAYTQDGLGIVNVEVEPTCTLENTHINMGVYDFNKGAQGIGTIKHSCSPGITYTLSLVGGTTRYLTHEDNSSNARIYIYKDSNKSSYFANSSSYRFNFTGTGKVEEQNVYAFVNGNLYLKTGKYKSVFVMEINY